MLGDKNDERYWGRVILYVRINNDRKRVNGDWGEKKSELGDVYDNKIIKWGGDINDEGGWVNWNDNDCSLSRRGGGYINISSNDDGCGIWWNEERWNEIWEGRRYGRIDNYGRNDISFRKKNVKEEDGEGWIEDKGCWKEEK